MAKNKAAVIAAPPQFPVKAKVSSVFMQNPSGME
jgi:hypothetical protein